MPRRKPLIPKEALDAMKKKPEPKVEPQEPPVAEVAVYSPEQISLVIPSTSGLVVVDVDPRFVRFSCECMAGPSFAFTAQQFDAIAAIRGITGRVR